MKLALASLTAFAEPRSAFGESPRDRSATIRRPTLAVIALGEKEAP